MQGDAQGAGAPSWYSKDLLRDLSVYQQLLLQIIIWRQKR